MKSGLFDVKNALFQNLSLCLAKPIVLPSKTYAFAVQNLSLCLPKPIVLQGTPAPFAIVQAALAAITPSRYAADSSLLALLAKNSLSILKSSDKRNLYII